MRCLWKALFLLAVAFGAWLFLTSSTQTYAPRVYSKISTQDYNLPYIPDVNGFDYSRAVWGFFDDDNTVDYGVFAFSPVPGANQLELNFCYYSSASSSYVCESRVVFYYTPATINGFLVHPGDFDADGRDELFLGFYGSLSPNSAVAYYVWKPGSAPVQLAQANSNNAQIHFAPYVWDNFQRLAARECALFGYTKYDGTLGRLYLYLYKYCGGTPVQLRYVTISGGGVSRSLLAYGFDDSGVAYTLWRYTYYTNYLERCADGTCTTLTGVVYSPRNGWGIDPSAFVALSASFGSTVSWDASTQYILSWPQNVLSSAAINPGYAYTKERYYYGDGVRRSGVTFIPTYAHGCAGSVCYLLDRNTGTAVFPVSNLPAVDALKDITGDGFPEIFDCSLSGLFVSCSVYTYPTAAIGADVNVSGYLDFDNNVSSVPVSVTFTSVELYPGAVTYSVYLDGKLVATALDANGFVFDVNVPGSHTVTVIAESNDTSALFDFPFRVPAAPWDVTVYYYVPEPGEVLLGASARDEALSADQLSYEWNISYADVNAVYSTRAVALSLDSNVTELNACVTVTDTDGLSSSACVTFNPQQVTEETVVVPQPSPSPAPALSPPPEFPASAPATTAPAPEQPSGGFDSRILVALVVIAALAYFFLQSRA